MRNYQDIGHGFFISFVQDRGIPQAGIIIWREEPREPDHRSYDPEEDPSPTTLYMAHAICIFARPDYTGTAWELHSAPGEPLHLEPSIQMYDRRYGNIPTYHGYIRNGSWQPV